MMKDLSHSSSFHVQRASVRDLDGQASSIRYSVVKDVEIPSTSPLLKGRARLFFFSQIGGSQLSAFHKGKNQIISPFVKGGVRGI
jgi:hypothetical protein